MNEADDYSWESEQASTHIEKAALLLLLSSTWSTAIMNQASYDLFYQVVCIKVERLHET